jgi:zinc D-Ala-D-Ala carboxypeptidase
LSKNFLLSEFIRSQTASRHKIDNYPPLRAIENLKLLCEKVLQPIRDSYRSPLIISSGYRCRQLNKLIGGASGSQHQFGEASDFSVSGYNHLEVIKWIEKNLEFDQLILEHWHGGSSGWIHCSYSRTHNRQQSLYIDRNGTSIGIIPKYA